MPIYIHIPCVYIICHVYITPIKTLNQIHSENPINVDECILGVLNRFSPSRLDLGKQTSIVKIRNNITKYVVNTC